MNIPWTTRLVHALEGKGLACEVMTGAKSDVVAAYSGSGICVATISRGADRLKVEAPLGYRKRVVDRSARGDFTHDFRPMDKGEMEDVWMALLCVTTLVQEEANEVSS